MAPKSSWLAGVAKILRAQTGDLRELAQIGGGDPATLYIGTRLDGVDIRGQDLRGMALPGLDVARVTLDEATCLDFTATPETDAAPDLPELILDASPLIFVASADIDIRSLRRSTTLPEAIVYSPGQVELFTDASKMATSAIFIVISPSDPELGAHVASHLKSDKRAFVTIVLEHPRPIWSLAEQEIYAHTLAPMITIIPTGFNFGPVERIFSIEARDVIRLLIDSWERRSVLLDHQAASYFMRARGIDPLPHIDAVAQLFERVIQQGLGTHETRLISFDTGARSRLKKRDQAWDRLGRYLLRASTGFGFTPASTQRRTPFDVGVFIPMSKPSWPTSEDYLVQIRRALIAVGWEIADDPPILRVVGERFEFPLTIAEELPPREIDLHTASRVRDFLMSDATQVRLSPRADPSLVVQKLLNGGELWVTARDLLGMPADAESLWLLVASQLRRITRSLNSRGKQLYLEILIRTAFQQDTYMLAEAWKWIDALNSEDFGREWKISASRAQFREQRNPVRIDLCLERAADRDLGRKYEATLWIDGQGVSLSDRGAPPPPGPQKPIAA